MSKITQSARNQECQVRLPAICNFDRKTTVLAHKNGGGMAMKSPDFHGAYACSSCHDVIDGREKTYLSRLEIDNYFYEGVFRTQLLLITSGLLIAA